MKKTIVFSLVLFSIVISIFLSACSNDVENNVDSVSDEILKILTPQETLETALAALKEADTKTFNSYVIYPEFRKGPIVYTDNILFGDNVDEEDKKYIQYVTKYMSYEIEDIQEDENMAIIQAKISNRDLNKIKFDMLNYSDADNPYIEAVKNAEDKQITSDIKISLQKDGENWKINVDDDFTKAISGGLWEINFMDKDLKDFLKYMELEDAEE